MAGIKRPSLTCGACPLKEKKFITLKDLNEHFRHFHPSTQEFVCGQGNCIATFSFKSSMMRHISNVHGDLLEMRSAEEVGNASDSTSTSCQQAHSSFDPMDVEGYGSDSGAANETSHETEEDVAVGERMDLNMVAAQIMLELLSKASLTGKAMERFQDSCKQLLHSYHGNFVNKMSYLLKGKGMSDEDIQSLMAQFDEVEDPFRNLKTIEEQLEFFSANFGLVRPQPKYLDTRIDKRLHPETNSYVQTEVIETFQYVSIIESLTALLSDKKNQDIFFNDYSSKDGVYRSYVDGNKFKNHPLFQKFEKVLQLILFYDDLEITNAQGSKTIIHKLGVFFFQILNAPAHISSKLSSIHLVALAHADDLKKPGAFDRVLKPFIHDMKKLSSNDGVQIQFEGKSFVLRAALVALTADTLAAHDLLGFLGASAKHFCRLCLISRTEFQEIVGAIGEIRTPEIHDGQVEDVKANPRLSSSCGVKGECPLNQIPHFHCCGGSVFDVFHDLLEGIVPLVTKCVLREFIVKRKLLTVAQLNGKLASFDYGIPDAKNKPSPNFMREMFTDSKKKIKQTGSQNWCLMRVLPFILGSLVPVGDEYMQLIFILQNIMQIVFAFEIRASDIDHLETLIIQHNELFKELFITRIQNQSEEQQANNNDENDRDEDIDDPEELQGGGEQEEEEAEEQEEEQEQLPEAQQRNRRKPKPFKVNMINKMHHLLHYPDLIRAFGPLIRFWCAKFEGRMKIFRQHSAIMNCFKNPPKTLAEMFQLSDCARSQTEDHSSFLLETSKGENVIVDRYAHPELFIELGCKELQHVTRTNRAVINGEDFRPGLFVCVSEAGNLQFSLISDIFILEEKTVYFRLKKWKIRCHSEIYNAYQVAYDMEANFYVMDVCKLKYFHAVAPWSAGDGAVYLAVRTIVL